MRRLLLALMLVPVVAVAADDYKLCPEATPADGVPRCTVTEHTFDTSKVFPGTSRKYWVSVPKQYDGKTPAAVMVFQDGGGYQDTKGGWRVPAVFDTLMHEKAMPVTVGVFVNPGEFPAKDATAKPRSNRSFEYDTASAISTASFLREGNSPRGRRSRYKLRTDAGRPRPSAASAAGGICAFTVAMGAARPVQQSAVVTSAASRTSGAAMSIPASSARPTKKPIRAYLQDWQAGDLDNMFGNWPLSEFADGIRPLNTRNTITSS